MELPAETKTLKRGVVVMPAEDQRRNWLDQRQEELGGSRHFASDGRLWHGLHPGLGGQLRMRHSIIPDPVTHPHPGDNVYSRGMQCELLTAAALGCCGLCRFFHFTIFLVIFTFHKDHVPHYHQKPVNRFSSNRPPPRSLVHTVNSSAGVPGRMLGFQGRQVCPTVFICTACK